jgi:ApaG protein
MSSSEAETRGIRVEVASRYDETRSRPREGKWFFLYTVTITNGGAEGVRLESRHWIVTDGEDRTEEVKGPGVVGKQPTLAPGESFRYTSGCPLETSFGTMHGSYQMVTDGGETFDAEIAPFMLAEPYAVH